MAELIQAQHTTTAVTLYALLRNSAGQIWNGAAFEAYATANLATYVIAMTEQGTASAYYTGSMPAAVAGVYDVTVRVRAGGAAAETDVTIATGLVEWTGTTFSVLTSGGRYKSDVLAINGTTVVGNGGATPWGP